MTENEFQKFFNYVAVATCDTKPSPAKMEVYWDALNDLPFEVAMVSARKIIATQENPFLPMPAIFRKEAAALTQAPILTAGEAYTEVLNAIRNYGSYKEVEGINSLDTLTQKAVRAVGWRNLCLSEEPEIISAQFRKAYEAMQVRAEDYARIPDQLKTMMLSISTRMVPQIKEVNQRTTDNELRKLEAWQDKQLPETKCSTCQQIYNYRSRLCFNCGVERKNYEPKEQNG